MSASTATVPAPRSDHPGIAPAPVVRPPRPAQCEGWSKPFTRCQRLAAWVLVLDVTDNDGVLRAEWSKVSACLDHRDEAHLTALATLGRGRAGVLHIIPTEGPLT